MKTAEQWIEIWSHDTDPPPPRVAVNADCIRAIQVDVWRAAEAIAQAETDRFIERAKASLREGYVTLGHSQLAADIIRGKMTGQRLLLERQQ